MDEQKAEKTRKQLSSTRLLTASMETIPKRGRRGAFVWAM